MVMLTLVQGGVLLWCRRNAGFYSPRVETFPEVGAWKAPFPHDYDKDGLSDCMRQILLLLELLGQDFIAFGRGTLWVSR